MTTDMKTGQAPGKSSDAERVGFGDFGCSKCPIGHSILRTGPDFSIPAAPRTALQGWRRHARKSGAWLGVEAKAQLRL